MKYTLANKKLKNKHSICGKRWLIIVMVACLSASCKVESIQPATEAVKDISGSWQVISATRNGTDLTSIFSFSLFRVSFNSGNYTLISPLPFIVSQNGTYSLDNPQYPYQITFKATGSSAIATAFTYPIVNGVRQLTLTFSPGCPNNTYIYTFQKVN